MKRLKFVFGFLFLSLILASSSFGLVDGSFRPATANYQVTNTYSVEVVLTPTTTQSVSGIDAYTYYDHNVFDVISVNDYYSSAWPISSVVIEPQFSRIKFTKAANTYEVPVAFQNMLPGHSLPIYQIIFKTKLKTTQTKLNLGDPNTKAFFTVNYASANVTGSSTPGIYSISGPETVNGLINGAFNPSSGKYKKDEIFNVDVTFTATGTQSVNGFDAYTYYDPSVLEVVSVKDYYPSGWAASILEVISGESRIKCSKVAMPNAIPAAFQNMPAGNKLPIYQISFKAKGIKNASMVNLGDPTKGNLFFQCMYGDSNVTGTSLPASYEVYSNGLINGSFIPSSGKYKRNEVFTVDVVLTPTENQSLSGFDAYTYYDPSVLEVVSVKDNYPLGWAMSSVVAEPQNSRIKCTKLAKTNEIPAPFQNMLGGKGLSVYQITFKAKALAKSTLLNLGDPAGNFFKCLYGSTNITGSKLPANYGVRLVTGDRD